MADDSQSLIFQTNKHYKLTLLPLHIRPSSSSSSSHLLCLLLMDPFFPSPANFVPLSPLAFFKRAAAVYGGRPSVIYGSRVFTWSETYGRCLHLASALVHHFHISPGDVVAAMAPNVPELYELHFAVPMAGAIISPLNTKLDAPTLSLLLQQLHPKVIFLDSDFLPTLLQSLSQTYGNSIQFPALVLIPAHPDTPPSEFLDYNRVLEMRFDEFTPRTNSELDAISINCTSGSTGLHKGVVYSHRAAYLNSLATIFRSGICKNTSSPVFLWTVDMFRCNGWCFIWAMAALGGCNICLRNVTPDAIFTNIELHKVTLLCGPSTLLKMIYESSSFNNCKPGFLRRVDLIVAGALPIDEILTKVTELGFNISYGYGMTEAMGPAMIRPWKPNFDEETVQFEDLIASLEIDVKDPSSMESVLGDGETLGEVMLRGNSLMSGYYKNLKATGEAFSGDWYRTGDVGVKHKSGRIEMKDRAKDIVVRENGEGAVSTVQVEAVLMSHPGVAEAAVIGERLCGLVKLKNGSRASAEEIVEFCRAHLPEFMIPERVVFGDLPMNSVGKVQKFIAREKAKALNTNNTI
ncbi:probable acyl-activating enzyme 1, peroxisomal [Cucurbita maxima]|uniref:Probable acyl-activating enzyme 1, peroxisomal n=1 Tax=Cucurbita maxima TaxID=3661 RepID=A0A6J1L3K3_CUCMA|nr:probable acyl-activating enzyme 1, peroxisomal [Cucurbita maxima]